MFTLIKREIQDHIVYFLAAALFSAVLIVAIVSMVLGRDSYGPPPGALALLFPATVVVVIGFSAMGASQMYTDRARKISAFLATLPVTRGRILIARIVTGILAILVLLVPLAVAAAILFRLIVPPCPVYPPFVAEIFAVVFLMGFACYCLGLQAGWSSNKTIPTLGSLALTCAIVPLIIIKGFGLYIVVILLALIVCCLVRTWDEFTSTSL